MNRMGIGDWGLDVRFGIRSLARTPGVTAAVVVMLALGIGANAAIFGILDRLFLRPPPHVSDPGALHRVYVRETSYFSGEMFTHAALEWPEFVALRPDTARLALAGYRPIGATRHGRGQIAEEVRVAWVSGEFFGLLGVRSARGRLIGPADEDPAAAPVAVIGDGYWRRRFNRSPEALGATVSLDDVTYTIVGVTPPGFSGPEPNADDVWLPVQHAASANRGEWWRRLGSGFSMIPFARLKPGLTVDAVEAVATNVVRGARAASTFRDTSATVLIGPLLATRGPTGVSPAMRLPLVVGGVALAVLLIATANVANLLMLRAAARRRELAVRTALGAGKWRVGRLLVVESVILALISGAAAAGVAALAGRMLRVTLLPRYSWAGDPLDQAVLLFAGATALAIGLLTGLVPAVQAARAEGLDDLRAGVRSARAARSPVRSALLVAQAALAIVLLIGAAVFFRSFEAARRLDIGYAKERLLTIALEGQRSGPRRSPLNETDVREMERRVRALPAVTDIAQGTNTPLGSATALGLRIHGMDSLPRMNGPFVNFVTPNFFSVAGLGILEGRGLSDADHGNAPRVAVVNTAMARIVWPDRSPIGACLYVHSTEGCATVVGVVESPLEFGLQDRHRIPHYFIPISQGPPDHVGSGRVLLVRTSGDPRALVEPSLRVLAELFPELPRERVRSLPDAFAPRIRSWKVGTGLFAAAASLALLLSAIGLYSVIAFGVRQREFEFGIRRALGAQASHLMRLVLVQGFALVALGVALGGGLALWAGKFVAPLLFEGNDSKDPAAFAVAAAALLAAALAASLLPARRAAKVDPRQALQAE